MVNKCVPLTFSDEFLCHLVAVPVFLILCSLSLIAQAFVGILATKQLHIYCCNYGNSTV